MICVIKGPTCPEIGCDTTLMGPFYIEDRYEDEPILLGQCGAVLIHSKAFPGTYYYLYNILDSKIRLNKGFVEYKNIQPRYLRLPADTLNP